MVPLVCRFRERKVEVARTVRTFARILSSEQSREKTALSASFAVRFWRRRRWRVCGGGAVSSTSRASSLTAGDTVVVVVTAILWRFCVGLAGASSTAALSPGAQLPFLSDVENNNTASGSTLNDKSTDGCRSHSSIVQSMVCILRSENCGIGGQGRAGEEQSL